MGYKLAILILREIDFKFSIRPLKAWLKFIMTPWKQKYYFFVCNPKRGPYFDFIDLYWIGCMCNNQKEKNRRKEH